MAKNNTTTTTAQSIGGSKYNVTPATAALLDCLTAASDLYDKITDALELRYSGIADLDEKAAPFLNPFQEIDGLLHTEISGQIIDALMDVKNSHAAVTNI